MKRKQLSLNTFLIHTILKPGNFSHKLEPLCLGPYKILQHLSDVIYEFMAHIGGSTLMVLRFTLIEIVFYHIIPKNLLYSHISVIQHPLFSITLILNRIKILILTLPQVMIFHLNNFKPIAPPLNTTPTHKTQTPMALQTKNSLIIPLSDTEFPLDLFDITPTHSPHPSFSHIPDPSDIDPILLRIINKYHTLKRSLIPTSIKGRRRHSQFDPSLPLPKPCSHSQPGPSHHPPKPSKIPVFEPIEILVKNFL